MSKDDQDWLDALAGKPDPGADADTNRRAAALRGAMLDSREKEIASGSPDDGLDRLLFRLRREGLMENEKKSWLLRPPVIFAMAATVLLAVGLGLAIIPERIESAPDVIESANLVEPLPVGGASSPQTLFSATPEDMAENIRQDFSTAEITLKQSASGQNIHLDADLPENLSPDALRIFERYRLSVPNNRKLVIEIRWQVTP